MAKHALANWNIQTLVYPATLLRSFPVTTSVNKQTTLTSGGGAISLAQGVTATAVESKDKARILASKKTLKVLVEDSRENSDAGRPKPGPPSP